MKKIIALLSCAVLVTSIYPMTPNVKSSRGVKRRHEDLPAPFASRYAQATTALRDYYSAAKSLDREKIDIALTAILEAREKFSVWDRWAYQRTHTQTLVHATLFDDASLLYYPVDANRFSDAPPIQPDILNLIKCRLGYDRYVDAERANSTMELAAANCSAEELEFAIELRRNVREEFPLPERFDVALPRALGYTEYIDRHILFCDTSMALEVYRRLIQNSSRYRLDRVENAIKAAQKEFDIQDLAVADSKGDPERTDLLRSSAKALSALYALNTPLNSANLLEHARQAKQRDIEKVIKRHEPNLEK